MNTLFSCSGKMAILSSRSARKLFNDVYAESQAGCMGGVFERDAIFENSAELSVLRLP